ncbi:hypothetical protein PM082_023013 [Marasmius tenuissimus]|nr:hypothetical protein PM082_023013 [Marasmius tenuissimus]
MVSRQQIHTRQPDDPSYGTRKRLSLSPPGGRRKKIKGNAAGYSKGVDGDVGGMFNEGGGGRSEGKALWLDKPEV